ncbi:urocanate hydratase [Lysinibacillus sp. LZ02]|uniref:urocanate hydratase n=1 Tax=Lysinibacillus sp. LZ02 TaxID=3420668 RepID=UPI003D35ABFE
METIRVPIGQERQCQNDEIEGLYRMFLNCLDPRVAENSPEFIVYGGVGKATKNNETFHETLHYLKALQPDETLLIQSGQPVAIMQTFESAPRVLITAAMLAPDTANMQHFNYLCDKDLTMYGQATAASWSYIGVQGILQTTFETFHEIGARYFQHSLAGKIVLSSGLGGMGSAQPISVTMNGGVSIIVEIDENKINRGLLNNYCDVKVDNLKEAITLAKEAAHQKMPYAIALVGNAIDVYKECLDLGFVPNIVTDQTATHDLLNGLIPQGLSFEQATYLRTKKPKEYLKFAKRSVVEQVKSMLQFQEKGAIVFDYGNNIRAEAFSNGLMEAFSFPVFTKEYIRPFYFEGRGPCRWIALSGNPNDIYIIDNILLNRFSNNDRLTRWIQYAQEKLSFHGLPARTCWLNYEERILVGEILHELVKNNILSGPIVMTRDHSEGSTIAAPHRETESMLDGSDMIADWPILTALLNTSCGASLVSIQHGAGVGIGKSIHTGMSVVIDGTDNSHQKLTKVLEIDPAMNIIRHADAQYEKAQQMLEKLKKYKF